MSNSNVKMKELIKKFDYNHNCSTSCLSTDTLLCRLGYPRKITEGNINLEKNTFDIRVLPGDETLKKSFRMMTKFFNSNCTLEEVKTTSAVSYLTKYLNKIPK